MVDDACTTVMAGWAADKRKKNGERTTRSEWCEHETTKRGWRLELGGGKNVRRKRTRG